VFINILLSELNLAHDDSVLVLVKRENRDVFYILHLLYDYRSFFKSGPTPKKEKEDTVKDLK